MDHLLEEKVELLCDCRHAEEKRLRRPHQTKKYWIITFIVHATTWTLGVFVLNNFYDVKFSRILSAQSSSTESDELIGTISCK